MTSSLRATIFVLHAVLSASALELSGTVFHPDGKPCPGVTVGLASGGATVTTDASGAWRLGSGVAVDGRSHRQAVAGHLAVVDGRIRFSWGGRDLAGRASGVPDVERTSRMAASRAASAGIDTIVYSLGGKVFLRDTASISRSGIIGTFDTTWNASVIYGWLTDARDGRFYRTVKIWSRHWMAENLKYRNAKGSPDTVGVCFAGSLDSCSLYGRLYTWSEVMDTAKTYDDAWLSIPLPRRGICPEGWHVPSDKEWQNLEMGVGMTAEAAASTGLRGTKVGGKLRSTSGWSYSGNGTDAYGFRVLPANLVGGLELVSGTYTAFWTASEESSSEAWFRGIGFSHDSVGRYPNEKVEGVPLRCIQDLSAADSMATKRYTLKTNATNGSITLSPPGGTYDSGIVVTATVKGSSAYVFSGWSGACTGATNASCTVTMTRDTSLTANFTKDHAAMSIPWNVSVSYGTFVDSRDQQTYRTVKIGDATWMAENLNYRNTTGSSDTVGVCYKNSVDSCSKYGRHYTWSDVMDTASTYDNTLLNASLPRRGICPEGWHVPSDAEWQSLEVAIGMSAAAAASATDRETTEGTKLKSSSGWTGSGSGTDAYGFRVLPAGYVYGGSSSSSGNSACFWSVSEKDASDSWYRSISDKSATVNRYYNAKIFAYSLRCRQD